jgi:hypothetical protein
MMLADSSLWLPVLTLFGGAGGALLVFFLTKADGGIAHWRKTRQIRRESSVVGIEFRVKALEDQYKYLYDAMKEVLQFIKGSEDPFTKEISGGLLAFMARIEDRLPSVKDGA